MSGWDIDPAGVSGVLGKTRNVADDFEGQLTSINDAMAGGSSNSSSEIVAKAISDYATSALPDIKFVVQRTSQAMTAAVKATNAYLQGDLEMAATAQRTATAPPPVDDMQVAPGGQQR
jgi:hypothetical protein